MGVLIDFSERGGDVRRFDEGLKAAKQGLMEVCDIWESMKQDFQMRGGNMGGYNQRSYNERYGGGSYDQRSMSQPMMSERDWADLQERRRRDGMGRFY